jgi:hypothetical protein
MNQVERVVIAALNDGDVFSVDRGFTWHVFCFHYLQCAVVYCTEERGEDAPCRRIECDVDDVVLVLR